MCCLLSVCCVPGKRMWVRVNNPEYTPNTNSKYELRSYLESRWRRQSRLASCETFGFERLLAHLPHSNSSICNLGFELTVFG